MSPIRYGRQLRGLGLAVATAGLVGTLLLSFSPVDAAPGVYASWTMQGSGGAYSGTMTLPDGYPAATFTSNARADSAVESGASTWLGAGTPFGAVYGSSQNNAYLRLRPQADGPLTPSTTTYVFASPTPTSGWGFALGDIDADQVEISATDASGNPVPVAGLGFQGVFNYCDPSPRPSVCSGQPASGPLPSWQPGTTSGLLLGHAVPTDTVGSSAWFQPTVPLSTLTFVFTQRSGFPVYQTWFAALPSEPPTTTSPSTSTTSTTLPPPTTSTTTSTTSTTSTTAPPTTTSTTSTTVPSHPTTTRPAGPGIIGMPHHPGGSRPAAATKPKLPVTGNRTGLLVLIGIGLVAAGTAVLRLPRRAR